MQYMCVFLLLNHIYSIDLNYVKSKYLIVQYVINLYKDFAGPDDGFF